MTNNVIDDRLFMFQHAETPSKVRKSNPSVRAVSINVCNLEEILLIQNETVRVMAVFSVFTEFCGSYVVQHALRGQT